MRIARRVRRVEAASAERQLLHAMAHWVADRHGVTADEVFVEARRLRDEAWSQGVDTAVIVARECGTTITEVRAETARLLAEAEAVGV
jgi:putative heme degradation protein